ncbi:MAG: glycosyltransferase [Bacilli bacterium]|nr:glycosyltransferase [Bacilli bacterium]MBR4672265.1 glycosyltransferase [Bacilli bacterium]
MRRRGLISVIVPIYNVSGCVEKCIDSIIVQTYSDLEIILIDDGSTDGSGEICDRYEMLDSRIIVVHKDNGGLSSARNTGLSVATGDFISFVDSDDYLENSMLEELKKNMEEFDSDISICNFYFVDKMGKKKNFRFSKNNFVSFGKDKFVNIQNQYDYLTVYSWNKLYKKMVFSNIRYPEGRIYEDSYALCDILNNAYSVSYILKPLYNYVKREDSITNSFDTNHFDKIGSFNKKIDFFNDKGYFDLAKEEKNRKMTCLIINLSKIKRYGIKDKEIEKKYYQELVNTNKEVKWKGATKYNKFYKVFRKPSINILACLLRVRDLIKKQ